MCRILAFLSILSLLFLCTQAASLITFTPSQYSSSACTTSTCVSSAKTIVYGNFKLGNGVSLNTFTVSSDGRISFTSAKSVDAYYSPASADTFIANDDPNSGVYYGNYQGASPVDNYLQITSQGYIMSTWYKLGYQTGRTSRINSYQAVIATDNTNTYTCFIYPDAASAGNINGGLDWTNGENTGIGGTAARVGFRTTNSYNYELPDSGTDRVRGIDGVPGDGPVASFTGTHAPGVFCFLISGGNALPLGPAVITSPVNGQLFSSGLNSVAFAASGLLNSRPYIIKTTSTVGTVSFNSPSNSNGVITQNINLSSHPDGPITIDLYRSSDGTTISIVVTKDTVTTGTITSPSNSGYVQNSLTITGTGEVGATVALIISDTSSQTTNIATSVVVPASGMWSTTVSITSQAEGLITVSATFTDTAGNTLSPASKTTTKDTLPPAGAITAPANGITVQNSVTVTGTGQVGATVLVTVSDSVAMTTNDVTSSLIIPQSGTWSTTMDVSSQSDGSLTISATFTDAAGNSQTPATRVITKGIVPVTGTITSPTNGAYVANSLTVAGSGDIGSNVVVTISDTSDQTANIVTSSITIGASGTWTTTVSISSQAQGMITVSATFSNAFGGNLTPAPRTVTKDTLAPAGVITSPVEGVELQTSVTVSGTGEPNARVLIVATDGSGVAADIVTSNVVVDAMGFWTTTMYLTSESDGPIDIYARFTDAAGNSQTTPPVEIIKDTVPPNGVINRPGNGDYVQNLLLVTGVGEQGATVYVTIIDTSDLTSHIVTATTLLGEAKRYTYLVNISSLSEGALIVTATFTDPAGNSDTSRPRVIRKDTIPPTSGTITSPSNGDIVGNTITVTGTGEPGVNVVLTISDELGSTTNIVTSAVIVDDTGAWSTVVDISSQSDGPISISATFADPAGNTLVPTPVSVIKDTITSGIITSPSSGATVSAGVTVTGTGEPGANVVVTITGSTTTSGSTTVNQQGTWSIYFDITAQIDGTLSILATFTDTVGNTATATRSIIKDTVVFVTITNPIDGSSFNLMGLSNLAIRGTGEAAATVYVVATASNGVTIRTASTTVSNGETWSLSADLRNLVDGPVDLVAYISDLTVNTGYSVRVRIIKDTVTFVSILFPVSSTYINSLNSNSMTFSGQGEVGGVVFVTIDDASSSTPSVRTVSTQVSPNGSWSISLVDVSSLVEGTIRATATITDAVGNTQTSNSVTLYKDVSITVYIAVPSTYQFIISEARAPTVSVSGFADPGTFVFVTIYDAARATVISATVPVTPVGTWSMVVDVSSLTDGLLTFIATGTDGAGNVATSNIVDVYMDTVVTGFSITSPVAGASVSSTEVASFPVSGTGEAGGRVSLRITGSSGIVSKSVSVAAVGTWTTVVNLSTLPSGQLTIAGTTVDPAGNTGSLVPVVITKN